MVDQHINKVASIGLTYLKGPAGSVFVVVADSLELASSGELPEDKLETTPQTFAVEEHEELGHHSGEQGIRWQKWVFRACSSEGSVPQRPVTLIRTGLWIISSNVLKEKPIWY